MHQKGNTLVSLLYTVVDDLEKLLSTLLYFPQVSLINTFYHFKLYIIVNNYK